MAQRGESTGAPPDPEWFMPDEGDPHLRTWMAFGASEEVWGEDLLPEVRRNLASIARAIVNRLWRLLPGSPLMSR